MNNFSLLNNKKILVTGGAGFKESVFCKKFSLKDGLKEAVSWYWENLKSL